MDDFKANVTTSFECNGTLGGGMEAKNMVTMFY